MVSPGSCMVFIWFHVVNQNIPLPLTGYGCFKTIGPAFSQLSFKAVPSGICNKIKASFEGTPLWEALL